MPKTGKDDHARKEELPSTLQRSEQKAQDAFHEAYDSGLSRMTTTRAVLPGQPLRP